MRIAVATLLTIALVATGLLLALDVAVQVAPSPLVPAPERRAAPTDAEIFAFYDAANAVLAGSGTWSPRAGFSTRLTSSTRTDDAVFAHLKTLSQHGVARLEVEEIVADGREAAVLVAGYPPQLAIGLGGDAPTPLWRTIDSLRIVDGAVADYVPGPKPPLDRPSLPAVTFAALPGDMDVSLARIELAPGASLASFMAPYPHLVMVESGTVLVSSRHRVAFARPGDAAFTHWTPDGNSPDISLGPGDAMTLPEGAGATLRNEGLAPVSAYSLLIAPHVALSTPQGGDGNDAFTVVRMHDPQGIGQPVTRGPGITTTMLAASPLSSARERARSIRVVSDVVLLEPGERMPPVPADRVTVVAVNSGTVSVSGLTTRPTVAANSDASPPARILRGGEAAGFTSGSAPLLENAAAAAAELLLFEIAVTPDRASPAPG